MQGGGRCSAACTAPRRASLIPPSTAVGMYIVAMVQCCGVTAKARANNGSARRRGGGSGAHPGERRPAGAAATASAPGLLHLAHLRLHPATHLLQLHHPPVHPVQERPQVLVLQRQVQPPRVQDHLTLVVLAAADVAVLTRGRGRGQRHGLQLARGLAQHDALQHRVLRRQRLHRRPRRELAVPRQVLAALGRQLLVAQPPADLHLLLVRQAAVNLTRSTHIFLFKPQIIILAVKGRPCLAGQSVGSQNVHKLITAFQTY
uniref:Uncharacterized protein n=1 Tax=Zea mays TaxID=4577 RepID=A0A804QFQ2_MAIZE